MYVWISSSSLLGQPILRGRPNCIFFSWFSVASASCLDSKIHQFRHRSDLLIMSFLRCMIIFLANAFDSVFSVAILSQNTPQSEYYIPHTYFLLPRPTFCPLTCASLHGILLLICVLSKKLICVLKTSPNVLISLLMLTLLVIAGTSFREGGGQGCQSGLGVATVTTCTTPGAIISVDNGIE